MSKTIRWGLVGLGKHAETIADAVRRSHTGRLVAVASQDRARAREFAARFGARLMFSSADDLAGCPDVDAVFVASPDDRHASAASAVLRAGKHVLVEKPMTRTVAEAKHLVAVARQKRRVLGVGFHLRFRPAILEARVLIRNKKIGTIKSIEAAWSSPPPSKNLPPLPRYRAWRNNPSRAAGGALAARGVHLFDLLSFLTGKSITNVEGTVWPLPPKLDVAAVVTCSLGKTLAAVYTSRSNLKPRNFVIIRGTRGVIRLDDALDPSRVERLTLTVGDKTKTRRFRGVNAYAAELDGFADAVRGRKTTLAVGSDGVESMEVLENVRRPPLAKRG